MTQRTHVWTRLMALLLAFALIAAACGGDDDDGADGGDGGGTETETDTDGGGADEGDGGETDGGETDGGETDGGETDGGETDGGEAMTPVTGGTLTYLLEAESDTWDIPGANCAVSCIQVMRTVADPLTIVNSDGDYEPYLAESVTPNEDFTVWTIVMRDGIVFHDGTPADGAAVHRSLTEMASGVLQGQVFVDLAEGVDSIVLVDPKTVTVTFNRPNAPFGLVLAERTGWLIAPSFWDDPDRASALMIGTGPFQMTEWTRGDQTVVTKNPNYWRTDANGVQLPYLDEIVFRPVPDVQARRAAMEGGDADAQHDSFGENLAFWREEWTGGRLDSAIDRDVTYLMFNNSVPPFDNVEMRRALALCTDREQYIQFRAPGNEIINGPFAEGALGFLDDPGFPTFDAAAGNALLDEIGRPEVINYGTTNVPSNLLTAELFAQMWSDNCGLTVNIDQFDQSELITKALTGAFEVFLWRNHGQGNPALELVWWHSRHAQGLALNFGRLVDPEIDQLLFDLGTTNDRAELDAIAQQINREFGDGVYNLWLNTNEWEIPHQTNVHGIGVMNLESGNVAQHTLNGRTWLTEAWKDAG